MTVSLVLGNGKSLLDCPKDYLSSFPSFGSNYIGLSGIQPTYFVCVDHRQLQDFDGIRSTAERAKKSFLGPVLKESSPIYGIPNAEIIHRDEGAFKAEKSLSGGTVGYVMLKMAFYLSDEVWMWGMDFDPNWEHFCEDYPCPGNDDRKVDAMLYHMRLASEVYKMAGKPLLNFSLPSVLDDFIARGT